MAASTSNLITIQQLPTVRIFCKAVKTYFMQILN